MELKLRADFSIQQELSIEIWIQVEFRNRTLKTEQSMQDKREIGYYDDRLEKS